MLRINKRFKFKFFFGFKQNAYKNWHDFSYPITELIHSEVLSLPISPVQRMDDTKKVVAIINAFVNSNNSAKILKR
jgi:dTDP-4-amino-4,6-dideoxygalactose transaminase